MGADRPAYEIRLLLTSAARAEAAALIEDRIHALAAQHIAPPYPHAPAAFREDRTEAVGLYENDADAVLAGCLVLHRHHDPRHWGVDDPQPGLLVSLAHTAPDRDGRTGWRMTMWLRDYAARLQTPWVYAEAPGWHVDDDRAVGRLLGHLRDLGWDVLGSGRGPDGQRVARLRLAAAATPGLGAMIHCAVPLATADGPGAEEAAAR
ncbi:hypothetical protein [Streptomyces sp. enrichment culture]|uniref:hypothetical protein n=1 Tax=Streptomyces sp. enrichment culture TaxID=1795815 RepID=UPI003F564A50